MYLTCASTANCNSSGRLDGAPPRPGPDTRDIVEMCCVDMSVVDFYIVVNVTYVESSIGSSGRHSDTLICTDISCNVIRVLGSPVTILVVNYKYKVKDPSPYYRVRRRLTFQDPADEIRDLPIPRYLFRVNTIAPQRSCEITSYCLYHFRGHVNIRCPVDICRSVINAKLFEA